MACVLWQQVLRLLATTEHLRARARRRAPHATRSIRRCRARAFADSRHCSSLLHGIEQHWMREQYERNLGHSMARDKTAPTPMLHHVQEMLSGGFDTRGRLSECIRISVNGGRLRPDCRVNTSAARVTAAHDTRHKARGEGARGPGEARQGGWRRRPGPRPSRPCP